MTETTSARDRLIQQVRRVVRNIDEATVHAYPSAARAIQAGAARLISLPP